MAYANNFVDISDAENVVQDVMFQFWLNAGHINVQESLSPYLHASVRNRCMNIINHLNVRAKSQSAIKEALIESSIGTEPSNIQELSILLQKALNKLPETQREAFEMHRFRNMNYKKIASETGVSVKTVEYRISQAVKKLGIALKDYIK